MIREAIIQLSKGQDIGYEMAKAVMNEIVSGEASDIQKSAYLTAWMPLNILQEPKGLSAPWKAPTQWPM